MSLPKFLCVAAIFLFGSIGIAAWMKGGKVEERRVPVKRPIATLTKKALPVELPLKEEVRVVKPTPPPPPPPPPVEVKLPEPLPPVVAVATPSEAPLPTADRMHQFFIRDVKQFPIVETIVYKSQVPWLKGRPAWLSDYAGHYRTSRHFIARSLHGKRDYFKQDVVEGDRFNVLRPDKEIAFYLVVDVMHCKMWFYYVDLGTQEKTLVKSYDVGLGRVDPTTASGFLTPLGAYTLGEKVGIYKTKSKGLYAGQEVQMISVFGTRWIPFEGEVVDCTAPPRGFGIHGCPWVWDKVKNDYIEDLSGIGEHESDGCVRMETKDIEELFSVIISRPTTIILVHQFADAQVPGIEKQGGTL